MSWEYSYLKDFVDKDAFYSMPEETTHIIWFNK